MGFFLFICIGFFAVMLWLFAMRINRLEARIFELADLLGAGKEGHSAGRWTEPSQTNDTPEHEDRLENTTVTPVRQSARVVTFASEEAPRQSVELESPVPVFVEEEVIEEVPEPSFNFEQIFGGKLPIWVGGIALVFAAFFMVRYSIEAGLFGPTARSITATLFALFLIALSEFGGRLPKIGNSYDADPRIAQSLAGAGVASLYATLYMASEIYALLSVPISFLFVLLITVLAFYFSLRRGPPTAVMGIIGGFAAPWVAGMGAGSVPTLLLYLGVFITAVFGLSLWRRWLWLLLLASGGGTLWTLSLILNVQTALPLIGLFVMVSGALAMFTMQRFGEVESPWAPLARYAPMALALVQLAMLLPRLEFSALGWAQYAALGLFATILAWRDERLLPVFVMAALVAIMPLAAAWAGSTSGNMLVIATVGYAILFGTPGYWRGLRDDSVAHIWAMIGLLAPVIAYFIPFTLDHAVLDDKIWGVMAAIIAIPSAWLAYQSRRAVDNGPLMMIMASTTICASMATLALLLLLPEEYWTVAFMAVTLGVAYWANYVTTPLVQRLPVLPLAVAICAIIIGSSDLVQTLLLSLSGEKAIYGWLPEIRELLLHTLIPSALLMLLARAPVFAVDKHAAQIATAIGSAGLFACIWYFAKNVLAISSVSDFINYGFAERAAITLTLMGAAVAAIHFSGKMRDPQFWVRTAILLTLIALARIVYFDLLLLNPLMQPQKIGPAPIANLGTILFATMAAFTWWLSRRTEIAEAWPAAPKNLLSISLAAAIIAALITVRQLMHGSLIAGGQISTAENYLYSAALMLLALAWLAAGIKNSKAILRVAGLGLLTAVTFKVFLIDAASLTGLLRILSFLGLGVALIGIGWAYGRLTKAAA